MERWFDEQSRDLLMAASLSGCGLRNGNDLMPLRIYEALAAIEQRLLSPMDAIEQRAVDDAQTGLLTLKAERIAEGKHVIHEGQLSEETC
jgi:hypothetical protein